MEANSVAGWERRMDCSVMGLLQNCHDSCLQCF